MKFLLLFVSLFFSVLVSVSSFLHVLSGLTRSLMVLYNSDAAAKSTFFLSVLLGVLMAFNILPEIPLSFLICYLNFIIILIFWQDIKEIFMKPQLLFVDKLSIPQDDEKLKQDCIMGLGGYLRSSRNLVILWSEGQVN